VCRFRIVPQTAAGAGAECGCGSEAAAVAGAEHKLAADVATHKPVAAEPRTAIAVVAVVRVLTHLTFATNAASK